MVRRVDEVKKTKGAVPNGGGKSKVSTPYTSDFKFDVDFKVKSQHKLSSDSIFICRRIQ